MIDYNSHKLLIHNGLAAEQTEKVIKLFREEKLDFTVHFPIPDNHKFYYHQVNSNNIEFSNYCDFYRGHCTPADFSKPILKMLVSYCLLWKTILIDLIALKVN